MRRTLHVAALAGLMALPAMLSAQAAKKVSIGISGGLSLPMGDLGNAANSGYNITGHYFYKPAKRQRMLFRADVAFDAWGGKETAAGSSVDASLNSVGLTGNAVFMGGSTRSTARPYLIVGAGFARTSYTLSGATTGLKSNSTNLAIQGGAGLEFALSGMASFLEAKYVNAMRDPTSWSYVPITFGVRF